MMAAAGGNGFLDDLPDLGLTPAKKKNKKPQKTPAPVIDGEIEMVIWQPVRCPRCGSDNVPIHTSRAPVRYHKCSRCKLLFKSVESRA